MTELRPQFSILALLAAISIVAIVLGIRLYIDPRLYWRDLWTLTVVVALSVTSTWLLCSAPRSARVFAIAFAVGAVTELLALSCCLENDLVLFTAGAWTPEGWYPLSLPIERLFVNLRWKAALGTPLPGMFAGMVVSGAVFGVLALALLNWIVRPIFRNKTVTSGSQPVSSGDRMPRSPNACLTNRSS
jgi:hypothetical protein